MAATYRVGIVGLSEIGAGPLEEEPAMLGGVQPYMHAASYARVPECWVVAICDLQPALFERFDERWAGTWPRPARYSDYREMLERERLDVISVVTPDHRHAQIVIDAAAAGVRGIYCEKPMATTLREADAMIAAVESRNIPMIVNHTRRWEAEYFRARAFLDAGHLGAVRSISGVYGGPRGILFRNGTHLVDAVSFFARSEPVWVVAHLDAADAEYGPIYAGQGGRDAALDPGGTALIRFENGINAFVTCTKTVARGGLPWEITVDCERGRIRIAEPNRVDVISTDAGEVGGLSVRSLPMPQHRWNDGVAAVRELLRLIESPGDGYPTGLSSPRDARGTLAVLLAMLQSQARGNVPVVAPFADDAG